MKTILHIQKKEECNTRAGSGMQKTRVRFFQRSRRYCWKLAMYFEFNEQRVKHTSAQLKVITAKYKHKIIMGIFLYNTL